MKVAIVVGHDVQEQGAYSKALQTSEYNYNYNVASHLNGFADIFYRPIGKGYKTQMEQLAKVINPLGYDFVVELHFNSFNGLASGCETVGFQGSKFGERAGKAFCNKVSQYYNTNNRGHKTTVPSGRGYWFTKLMAPPALILEPFFGDTAEALKFQCVEEYACIIREWIEAL